ncbi:hypothetical protein Amir_2121 [Actinosynnema mirum DSM 43827]|uniref:DUF5753 domain-containing protein n=1 Tax=Actinosynnema mirum (strain ATCC 29888 / DSM 43827 / JCM 3225 / NBRC 14064 / NCIMB 13271 / NRRL B-12336 / IMRU 3971 / 101) TaxID=446462 RepID=C6WGZ8_ACTMD|nr:hypothetical protein Amir_2121 [Actinosynnema mirum DSM 43827]
MSPWPLWSPSKRIAVDVVDLVRLVGGSQRGDERRARSLVCYEVLVVPEWLRTADYALAYGCDNGFGNGGQGDARDGRQGGAWNCGQGGTLDDGQDGARDGGQGGTLGGTLGGGQGGAAGGSSDESGPLGAGGSSDESGPLGAGGSSDEGGPLGAGGSGGDVGPGPRSAGEGGAGADLLSGGVSSGDVEPGPSTPPPDSAFYLHEAVLHTPVGGPGAHARQLLALAASPWPVRVVPFGVGAHPALARPFVYLEFADAPPVAYSGGRVESAGPHREALAVLEELALGVDASRALLATWKTAVHGPLAGRGAACTSDTPDSH